MQQERRRTSCTLSWEMNAVTNTQSPQWSPARDSVCFSLPDVFIEIKTFENTVCFDKNLGSLGSALNLLEGKKINHCFYKNVFTRDLVRKMQTYAGGWRSFLLMDIEERNI